MKARFIVALVLFAVSCWGVSWTSWAARLREPREWATHVVTGEVLNVYEELQEKPERIINYVIEIRIHNLEKGASLKSNDRILVKCYKPNPRWRAPSNGRSWKGGRVRLVHSEVPKKGERIRAFLEWKDGSFEGIDHPAGWFNSLW